MGARRKDSCMAEATTVFQIDPLFVFQIDSLFVFQNDPVFVFQNDPPAGSRRCARVKYIQRVANRNVMEVSGGFGWYL